MTSKEKQLLLKDLCARLPYRIKVGIQYGNCHYAPTVLTKIDAKQKIAIFNFNIPIEYVKPYLRPMSSMTEEESSELGELITIYDDVDWMLAHHFDVHNLIEKGLALEAPVNMYKTE